MKSARVVQNETTVLQIANPWGFCGVHDAGDDFGMEERTTPNFRRVWLLEVRWERYRDTFRNGHADQAPKG